MIGTSFALDALSITAFSNTMPNPTIELLAGDIGGTKTILRWVEEETAGTAVSAQSVQYEQEYPSQDYPDLVPMVEAFYDAAAAAVGRCPAPQAACFAIAGPVVKNTSHLTNLNWKLSGEALAEALSIEKVELINDFAAIGYGLAGLELSDLETLQPGTADPDAPIAVLGAGTGLGECFVVGVKGKMLVFSTEGGHTDFAPRTDLEFRLLQYIQHSRSLSHVSVERIVSGQGVLSFYQFLRDQEKLEEDPKVAAVVRAWEQADERTGLADPGAAIAQAAAHNHLCQRTMDCFVEAYGAEAGNLALKLLSYGGVYIAGGIAAKNVARMKAGPFMEAFLDKGRMRSLLEKMPVQVILNQQVGLIGAALHAGSLLG